MQREASQRSLQHARGLLTGQMQRAGALFAGVETVLHCL